MSEPTTNDSIANGTATIGRLVFMSGAAEVAITADPTLPDLYRARFAHRPPSVRVEQSTVILHYRIA